MKRLFTPRLFITLLRIAIGWHFLYEGMAKLIGGNFTSLGYLQGTSGFAAPLYHWLGSSAGMVRVIDLLNMYGLVLIGLGLFVGLLIRYAAFAGTVLLVLYYFAYPPFGSNLFNITEGHLFIVDKLFLEAAALMFIAFWKEKGYSIDSWLALKKSDSEADPLTDKESLERRELLKGLAGIPVLGVLGWSAISHLKKFETDVTSGATVQLKQLSLNQLKGELPKGKIMDHQITRLVMGGNLIGGWAHSRDLIYVSSLFKAYNTEKKVYETLMLGEQAGINAINIGFSSNPLLAKYKKITGSKLKVISQVGPNKEKNDPFYYINEAIDYGVDIIQIQGNWCDWLVRDKQIETIARMMEHIRKQGYTAGLGAHTIDSLIACEEYGIIPDYYMKTMHHDHYWSAHPRENRVPFEVDGTEYLDHDKFHNNLFDLFPERTIEFVNRTKVPVMGFKVLAAGAIEPKDGFRYAFENGADFICVGMFDFQLVDDVNITLDILNSNMNRSRAWS
jgi:uncharacterized membrane protein YphA (DoxX/SURF4 family)